MSDIAPVNLKKLTYSPNVNPLVRDNEITLKKKHLKTGVQTERVNGQGEITHIAKLHEVVEKDDREFVKVFAAGVIAAFELKATASKVFMRVLEAYELEPMTGGYCDSIYLSWFGGGLCGRDIGMSEKTFQRGLKELLAKGFLSPKSPNVFWVNPSLIFKGDRAIFIREYRRKAKVEVGSDAADREHLEAKGQQRLIE